MGERGGEWAIGLERGGGSNGRDPSAYSVQLADNTFSYEASFGAPKRRRDLEKLGEFWSGETLRRRKRGGCEEEGGSTGEVA